MFLARPGEEHLPGPFVYIGVGVWPPPCALNGPWDHITRDQVFYNGRVVCGPPPYGLFGPGYPIPQGLFLYNGGVAPLHVACLAQGTQSPGPDFFNGGGSMVPLPVTFFGPGTPGRFT